MHASIPCLTLPVLVAAVIAQAPTNTLNLQPLGTNTILAHTPRAGWTAVTSAGTTSPAGTGTTYGTWRNSTPAVSDGNDAIYVFGGRKQSAGLAAYNDLYKFQASTGTLTMLIGDGVAGSPGPRERHGACWNPSNGKMYIYAGFNFAGGLANPTTSADCLSDIWEYSPGTNTWANVTPVSGNPTAREFAGLAYDPANTALVMFGGSSGATGTWNDTWLFFPNATAGQPGIWVPMTPVTIPPARNQHNLNTRFDVGDVVMDSGADSSVSTSQRRLCDIWRWNGSNWILLYDYDWVTPSGTFPASTLAQYSCYDPLRKRIVRPGGNGISAGLFTGTSGTATCTPSNGDHTYLYFNNSTGFYEALNGQPVNWTSEFDTLTNTWIWCSRGTGNVITGNAANDPVIGRVSRNAMAFAPSTGKVYMLFGQNAVATGAKPVNNVYEYQANPVASTTSTTPLCTGSGGLMTLAANNLPWLNTTLSMSATGMAANSYNLGYAGFGTTSIPVNSVLPQGIPGCLVLQTLDLEFFVGIGSSATWTIPLPDTVTLVGLTGYLQYASAEFDLSLNVTAIGTSNLLTVVLGQL